MESKSIFSTKPGNILFRYIYILPNILFRIVPKVIGYMIKNKIMANFRLRYFNIISIFKDILLAEVWYIVWVLRGDDDDDTSPLTAL